MLLVVSGAVRLYHLGYKSLWYDEAVLYWISQGSISKVLQQNALRNSAPPFYPILINLVSHLGSSEFTLRFVSWLAGVTGVLAFYFVARRLTSRRAAISCSILLSVATFHVEYSQQLREYSLSFLLTCLLLLSYFLLLEKPVFRNWMFLVICSVVSILTQYGLVIVLITLNLYALLDIGKINKSRL